MSIKSDASLRSPRRGILRAVDIGVAISLIAIGLATASAPFADSVSTSSATEIDTPTTSTSIPPVTSPPEPEPDPSQSVELSGVTGVPGNPDIGSSEQQVLNQEAESFGFLMAYPANQVSGCGAPFVSPGEQVTFTAAGFAADTTVSFEARSFSLDGTELAKPQITAATADANGDIAAIWNVPSAPPVSMTTTPRAFIIEAFGLNSDGGTHTVLMGLPLVAYPATAPCANGDTAATTLGKPVQISVLTNDIAPTGGSLDTTSVEVRAARGGSFDVDAVSGQVTFTPDPGYRGMVETSYVVYDNWGIGVEADLTIKVDGGCTITGTEGVELIEGTSNDDVICVPDPGDRYAFHVIDAKEGNDIVIGGDGVEWIYGGDGADIIYSKGSDDRIVAGAGKDTVHSGLGMDYIYSTDLIDEIIDDENGYEIILSPTVGEPGLNLW